MENMDKEKQVDMAEALGLKSAEYLSEYLAEAGDRIAKQSLDEQAI